MNARHKLFLGFFLLGSLTLIFIGVRLFYPFDPITTNLEISNSPPSLTHPFGTDELGRDIVARTSEGVTISLGIGLTAFLIDLVVGGSLGAITAFVPKWQETLLLRIIEIIYSLPYLLVVILISVYTGTGIIPIFAAILCIGWIHMSRVSYQLTKSSLIEGWAIAAEALGVSKPHLFFKHILPNTIHILLTTALLGVPYAIFTESFLSFLGVGIPPPVASLGSMVADALPAMRYYPWRLIFPAITIGILILSITLIQEAARDLFDPHSKKRFKSLLLKTEAVV